MVKKVMHVQPRMYLGMTSHRLCNKAATYMCMQCLSGFKASGLSVDLLRFAHKASKGASAKPPHFLLSFL